MFHVDTDSLPSNTYYTTFTSTENPISEGGRWINGLTTGLDWTDIQTVAGQGAYGTMTQHAHPPYDDSVALWKPPDGRLWADTTVEAQVFIDETARASWTGFHEFELLLRGQGTAHSWQQYECIFSANSGTTYTEIVRWNGALNAFTSLTGGAQFNLTINNGDWIKATIVGSTISLFHRTDAGSYGTAMTTASDISYASGWAGMGHWNNGAPALNSQYRFISWRGTQNS